MTMRGERDVKLRKITVVTLVDNEVDKSIGLYIAFPFNDRLERILLFFLNNPFLIVFVQFVTKSYSRFQKVSQMHHIQRNNELWYKLSNDHKFSL